MIFTLIVGTRGEKTTVLKRFFSSVLCQRGDTEIEIILVDQNGSQKNYEFYSSWSQRLNLNVVFDDSVGLSRARNIGLRSLKTYCETNRWLLYPDDDCHYPSDFFLNLSRRIAQSSADGFYFRVMSSDKPSKELSYTKRLDEKKLTHRNVFSSITSINFSHQFREGLTFDEVLGIGAEFFSSEEMDYVSRLIISGSKFEYCDGICVYHPDHFEMRFSDVVRKTWSNSLGHGAFSAKMFQRNFFYTPIYLLLIAPLARVIVSFVKFEFKLSVLGAITFFRRITGFLRYLAK